MIRAADILAQLDDQSTGDFPAMDHPDNFLSAARLAGHTDGEYWAISVEQLVFATAAWEYYQFRTWVYVYGSCLVGSPGIVSDDAVHPITEGIDGPLFSDSMQIRADVHTVRIRGRIVWLDASPGALRLQGIPLALPPEVGGWDLLRLLAKWNRTELLASDAERTRRIARPLTCLLRLDDWHHPDIFRGVKPGQTECFRLLAEALARNDASLYRPTEPPNTDWRHWPRGGLW